MYASANAIRSIELAKYMYDPANHEDYIELEKWIYDPANHKDCSIHEKTVCAAAKTIPRGHLIIVYFCWASVPFAVHKLRTIVVVGLYIGP